MICGQAHLHAASNAPPCRTRLCATWSCSRLTCFGSICKQVVKKSPKFGENCLAGKSFWSLRDVYGLSDAPCFVPVPCASLVSIIPRDKISSWNYGYKSMHIICLYNAQNVQKLVTHIYNSSSLPVFFFYCLNVHANLEVVLFPVSILS